MKKIKITQEQYRKITKLISENVNAPVVPDMGKKVNKQFKRAFAGSDVKKFMKESETDLKHETVELIKYLYRKTEDFSPFWAEHDLTYDDICDALESKGLIIKKDGKYEISKSLGSAENAKEKLESELSQMIGGGKEGIEEGDWFDSHPDHPANQSDPSYSKASISTDKLSFEGLYSNGEIAILKDKSGSLYAFYYDNISTEELDSIAYDLGFAEEEFVGKDEDGMPEFEYYYDWRGNDSQEPTVLAAYADGIANEAGEGLEAWESGTELVKIDNELKNELLSVYDKDAKLTSTLSGINEIDLGDIKSKLAEPFKQQPSGYEEKSPEEKEMIKQRLAAVRARSQAQDAERFAQRDAQNAMDSERGEEELTTKTINLEPQQSKNPSSIQTRLPFDETTSAGAIGGGTSVFGGGGAGARLNTPVGKFGEPLKSTFKEELNETTQGEGSIGQYDANALPIGRNGEFKNVGKTKAQTTPQYAGGAFVDFNDCTKLNNKPAGSGCSAGAVDGVVKLRKAKGSVNAPSLAENKIYETIAKQTGKTIDEVKRIIETKKNK